MSLKNKLMISAMAVVIATATASCKTVPKAQHINARSDTQCTTTTTSETTTTTTTATTELRTTTTETTMTSTSTETETEVTDVAIETETTCGGDICHTEPLNGYWDMTYYSATALGHTAPPCGASGNQLVEGYSVACDSLPFGTLIYLDSDYISGTFRVDDCGTGNSHTIDVYYWDNANVPYDFAQAGRVPVTITILE